MVKCLIFCVLIIAVIAKPESPVNSYLPSQNNERPSSQYGPPGDAQSSQRFLDNSNFGLNNFERRNDQVNTNYAPPNQENNAFNGQQEPNLRSNQVSPSYGPPSNSFGPSNQRPDSTNSNSGYGPSGQQNNGFGSQYGEQQNENNEPARYEFNYNVNEADTQFGHSETRDGDKTQGEYNVLLPDGRKQIVEYEADLNGFKSKVRYEGEARSGNGYPSGGLGQNQGDGYASSEFNPSQNNGYPFGGPPQTGNVNRIDDSLQGNPSGGFSQNDNLNRISGNEFQGYPSGGPQNNRQNGQNEDRRNGYSNNESGPY